MKVPDTNMTIVLNAAGIFDVIFLLRLLLFPFDIFFKLISEVLIQIMTYLRDIIAGFECYLHISVYKKTTFCILLMIALPAQS